MTMQRSMLAVELLMALFTCSMLMAQRVALSADDHIVNDRARELYRRSVFAHGYMHGYEDGFHQGDFDLQTGHDPQDPKRLKQFRATDVGYRREFGNRDQFRAAYRKGFITGYADAMAGRDFRAVSTVRRAADGLADLAEQGDQQDGTFDHGFREGYESGQVHGEVAGRDRTSYDSSPAGCAPGLPPPAGQSQDFCDGYARGYLMGYEDGYLARRPGIEWDVTAKNR